jgi:hypothetical protein
MWSTALFLDQKKMRQTALWQWRKCVVQCVVLQLRQMCCSELVLEPQWELCRFSGWVTRMGHQGTGARLQRHEHYPNRGAEIAQQV